VEASIRKRGLASVRKGWGKLFHNTAAASAIADRLVHKGILVRITGNSFRTNRAVDE